MGLGNQGFARLEMSVQWLVVLHLRTRSALFNAAREWFNSAKHSQSFNRFQLARSF